MSAYDSVFRRKAFTCLLISWLFFAMMLWGGSPLAVPSALSGNDFRQILSEHLLSGNALPTLAESPISTVNLRAIVKDNLGSNLLTRVMTITGVDYRFTLSGQQTESQIGMLILSYPDATTSGGMAKFLAGRGGYFKGTKILTRFSCATVGNQLVVVFTENSGNEVVVNFIDELPKLLNAGIIQSLHPNEK